MNGIGRLKRLEKIHADAIDPIYRVVTSNVGPPGEHFLMTPFRKVMNAEEYEAFKAEKQRAGIEIQEYYMEC